MSGEGLAESEVARFISETLPGVDVVVSAEALGGPEVFWGDSFFFYDPEGRLEAARRFPFATIVTKDYGDFDNGSDLNRPGIYRLNIGVSKTTYDSLFGVAGDIDYTVLDRLLPHPVYGRNHWVCVLNPSATTLRAIEPLLREAHERAVKRYHGE
jgi:hypothetical protein